jgi:thiol peroxidase
MSEYTAAIVGTGHRGREHALAYDQIDGAAPIACMARTDPRREELAAEFDMAAYDDLEELLSETDPDVVHVCTPPSVRVDVMEAVSAAGVPAADAVSVPLHVIETRRRGHHLQPRTIGRPSAGRRWKMAQVTLKGTTVNTVGELPGEGDPLPDFRLVDTQLGEKGPPDFEGRKLVLNIFPSIDTDVCAASVRRFNEAASQRDDTAVLCISRDLPFAQGRFCGAEGLNNVTVLSAFRAPEFGQMFGVEMSDGPLAALLARSVIVADEQRRITHVQLVPEITQEPDYEAALKALD